MPPDWQKASVEQAEKLGKESPGMTGGPQKASKNHPLLNHPLWLVWLLAYSLLSVLSHLTERFYASGCPGS